MAISRSRIALLLAKLERPVQKAFAIAVQRAKSRAQINALVDAIEAGNIEQILIAAGIRDGMYSPLTESIRSAYAQGGAAVLAMDLPKRFGMEFDINNPRAEDWLRKHSSLLITGDLAPEQVAAIQVKLQAGMIKGQNPRTTALDIVGRMGGGGGGRRGGGVIGLNEQQAKYAVNMAEDLEDLNPRYFNRKLRDKRFDKTVRKSFKSGKPLPKTTRDKLVGRYEDRMLKHRGNTIGRTETLRAVNEASDEALRQIVDEGLAPRNAVVRIWRHSFAVNEREGHLLMQSQERGIDELFINPITGAYLAHPGAGAASETINCRCYLAHKIDFAAVERAA